MQFSKLLKLFTILALLILVAFGAIYLYNGAFAVPNDSPQGKYKLVLKSGETITTLAEKLKNDKIINNADFLPFISKISVNPNLKAGIYELDLPAKPDAILWQINNQKPAPDDSTVTISLIEGDTAEDVAEKLEKANVIKSVDFLNYISTNKNFDLSQYPFLPNPDTKCNYGDIYKGCAKYYLEGYLYPDTYNFYLNSKPEVVATKFLKNFNNKVWAKFKGELNNSDTQNRDSFYTKLILASIVEREVGRNFVKAAITASDLSNERRNVSKVYLNRIDQKMKWQSDPTVWYGVDKKKGVGLDGNLNWGNSKYKTGYNTYQIDGEPVGPIANPSFDSIAAAFSPAQNDFLYFVSDRSGKMYFAKTNAEHETNISKVREINKNIPQF